tara:strand:+ start:721 stop:1221 length:501 start_codon:yes stop_codon:yes gene_type:complete
MRSFIFIQLSLLLAFLLDVTLVYLAIPEFRPSFFLLVLIYWNLALPERISLAIILIFGLIYDLFQGALFGVYGIAFLSITYIFQRFFYQFRTLSILQQVIMVFLISLFLKIYLAINLEEDGLFSPIIIDHTYMVYVTLHAFINSILWPVIFISLRAYRRKWIGVRR